MRCPYCGAEETRVTDSRPDENKTVTRRRRTCEGCGLRFTTYERIHLRELMVVKKNGDRVPFNRDKLVRSMEIALRKRDVAPDRIERAANGIVRRLETSGQSEFDSTEIGGLVMQTLKQIDEVAYVRYASVYRNFREVEEFERAVESLRDGDRIS